MPKSSYAIKKTLDFSLKSNYIHCLYYLVPEAAKLRPRQTNRLQASPLGSFTFCLWPGAPYGGSGLKMLPKPTHYNSCNPI